ncbi:MAG: DUF2478 domain-containing protein [Rhodospirillales bacterium]|nr:DUF2478 domain-containing protein [Rhodospirillales bacterium]MCW8951269.1 DUF2478 domain-containing protein [Rhodospirillales bacterium]MCW8970741.1 DUF2478 domain-containing protein [Rhodospirillales bacterium]
MSTRTIHHDDPNRSSTNATGAIKLGAVLYTSETARRGVLREFAEELKARGWRVGGIVQEPVRAEEGRKGGIDAIALDTGERIPINRPTRKSMDSGTCTLDNAALTESTAALRRAVAASADLLVVEKFGDQEQKGGGMADEILQAAVAGIPTLVMVPAIALERWLAFTGGTGDLIAADRDALWRWWGADNLYTELARAVPATAIKRVVVGLNWTLVEGPDGCGLAQTPPRGKQGCRTLSAAAAGRDLRQMAALATSWDPFEAALGIAAINAHHNKPTLAGGDDNGLDAMSDTDGTIAVVGRFPGIAERLPGALVIEREPAEGEYPEAAAVSVLGRCQGAIITSSSLVNRTLPGLLKAASAAKVALVGPGTPLAPGLFAYGADILSGLVIEDTDGAAQAVSEGCGARALRKFGRMLTLKNGA